MTCHLATQLAAAAARNREALGEPMAKFEFHVLFSDGSARIERVASLSEVAAYHPDAVQITRCDWGGFW